MWVRDEIDSVLTECWQRQGWTMPVAVQNYCVRVLVAHIDRPDWQPKPSWAESLLTVKTGAAARALGDSCLFARSVFPSLLERRGLDSSYLVFIGQSAYDRVLDSGPEPTTQCLRDNFEFVAEMLWTAVHSRGDFRSLWQD